MLPWLLSVDLGRAQLSTVDVSPILYNQGDPTDEEQYLLERLNRARMDPIGEGQRLADWLRNTPIGREIVAQYGTNPDQVASDFAALPAGQPLAFNAALVAAAQAHSADLAAHGGVGPNNDADAYWDGQSVDDHVYEAGYHTFEGSDGFGGGCAYGIAPDLDTVHAGYLVDWGNPDLGHRQNEMNSEAYLDVMGEGVATQANGHLSSTEYYGRAAMTCAFLTGVVYVDASANGLYDVGEGVAGVTVTVDGGTFSTVTSASGGYSLPLTREDGTQFADNLTGKVTVHMTNLPGGATRDATLTVHTVSEPGGYQWPLNVKWDAMVAPVPGSNPSAATLLGGGQVSRSARGKLTLMVLRPSGSDPAQPLAVSLTYKGTAVAGLDYRALPGTVTIPTGSESCQLKVKALGGDGSSGGGSAVTLTIKVKGQKGATGKATVTFVQ